MADYFVAISEDGVRFKLNRDGSWEPDTKLASNESIRFRKINWGDNIAHVKASEVDEPVFEDGNRLMYDASVGGFPVRLSFRFVNGMCCGGIYGFKQEHADRNSFIDDFETLKRLLTVKYGTPFAINDIWLNDLYRDDYSERGMALASGHHSIYALWQDDETRMMLQITGDNYEINLYIFYTSKRLEPLDEAEREQVQLIGL